MNSWYFAIRLYNKISSSPFHFPVNQDKDNLQFFSEKLKKGASAGFL
jgi:hypothetical protein